MSSDVQELVMKIQQAKIEYENISRKRKELVEKLFEAAVRAKVWWLTYHLGTETPKSHGYYRSLSFHWKGRLISLVLDDYNGYLKICINNHKITMGYDLDTFSYYITDDLGLIEEAIEILEDLAKTDIPKLVDLLNDKATYIAKLDGEIKGKIREILGVN
ncbi:MAG: hypothetical protein F7B59_04885 [Desulfurococcales archaeon]|nr:hypothetical protein [Desulfurococcales archaeon]